MLNKVTRDSLIDLLPNFDLCGMDLQLDRMRAALLAMGSPCKDVPAIQIAGTNGKGSIVSFIASALNEVGIRCGVTTSPHLVSWCERISINCKPILISELRAHLMNLHQISSSYKLTPFEHLLAAAFSYFHEQSVELLLLEVGLGGRLDATTAHPLRPLIGIANIGLDHCEILGDNLKSITREKAAVIKNGSTVVSAAQDPEVCVELEQICFDAQAELRWVEPLSEEWTLGLQGSFQKSNAAVAKEILVALSSLGWSIPEKAIKNGFASVSWSGRMQSAFWNGLPIRLDGAHNPPAAAQLARERLHWQNQEVGMNWIFAVQAHKQIEPMLRELFKPQDKGWIVPVPNHKSWNLEKLQNWSSQLSECKNAEEVFTKLNKQGCWPKSIPTVFGSLYLIGDLFSRGVVSVE